jgi:type VI secretion system protein ImpL
MLKILSQRWVMTLLAVIFLSLLIWFAGPYIAFAEHKPLEGGVARLLCILVLVIIWAAWLQLRQIRQQRNSAKLGEAIAGQSDGAPAGRNMPGRGEEEQLRRRFEEAVATLRKSRTRGRDLYSLPWYLIIGPPGSGKTTALEKSGLRFPLEQKFGSAKLGGVGGTRNCDWWFSDEAILLDTAGRYTTQDSDAGADSAAWGAFLNLLQKFRGRRPINGVLVAISAADLLSGDAKVIGAHVAAVKNRLEELSHHLGVRLPVYFLLTKCDLMAGFMEFFEDLGQEERRQVWGVTFSIAESEQGSGAAELKRYLDALLQRLESRRLQRLAAETDPTRRAAILAFPAQFAALAPALAELVKEAFSTSSFDEPILLRGVYLTSGTQESTPIDRAMGAIARAFGMDAQLTARQGSGAGRAYFVERLLREVLFREAGLAGTNRSVERRLLTLQVAAYIGVTILVVAVLLGFFVSYRANIAYIDSVQKSIAAYDDAPSPPVGVAGARIVDARPRLDAARDVSATANQYSQHVPWSMRFGLYRGGAIGNAAHDAYLREIGGSVLPVLGEAFRANIASSVADSQRLYKYLKAYLMLAEPKKRVDHDQLVAIANEEWRVLVPNDPGARRDLSEHFAALVEDPSHMRALTPDQALVERSQAALATASLPQLMFDRLRLAASVDEKHAVRLDQSIAAFGQVFTRQSGKPLSDPLSSLYTRGAFDDFAATGRLRLLKQFVSESWVLGSSAPSLSTMSSVSDGVLSLYEDNYNKTWDELLADLRLRSSKDPQELAQQLGLLGSPSGPLKQLFKLVDQNTDFSTPAPGAAGKIQGAIAGAVNSKLSQVDQLDGSSASPAEVPGAKITAHFAAYHTLVTGPDGAAPIDQILHSLASASRVLATPTSAVEARANQASVLNDVKAQAALLPPAIAQLVTQASAGTEVVLGGAARSELKQSYQQVLRDCREVVNGRYPFDGNSTVDVPLEDFKRVFGTGGIYDAFFRGNLQALVDTSNSPWRWREGAGEAAAVPGLLAKFQQVQQIRDVFFKPGGAELDFHFTMTPDQLDQRATGFTLQMDGRTLEYRHGPVETVPMQWPGSAAGQASIRFEPSGVGTDLNFDGPWAWFRLLARSQKSPQSDAVYLLTFTAGGMSAVVKLDAGSIRNPIAHGELLRFRCEG